MGLLISENTHRKALAATMFLLQYLWVAVARNDKYLGNVRDPDEENLKDRAVVLRDDAPEDPAEPAPPAPAGSDAESGDTTSASHFSESYIYTLTMSTATFVTMTQ